MSNQLIDIVNQAIEQAERLGVDAVDAALSDETGFSVTARSRDVETVEHHQEQGLVVTVYHEQRTGTASTSDLSSAAVAATVQKACTFARYAGVDPCAGLADKADMALEYPDLDLYHPWSISPAEAIQQAIELESIALEQDPRILHSEGASISTYNSMHIYGNSHGFLGRTSSSYHSMSVGLVAKEKDQMQREYEYTAARRSDKLDDIALVAKHAANKTIKMLGARKIKTQRCPVVFYAPVAKSFLGAFLGAISGGNLYRKTSFLVDHLHKTIFPKHISIYQQPHILSGMGSAAFDSEGVATKEQYYVKEGELERYILGSYSARQLKLETTGNAGGVFNVSIKHGDKNLAALLKELDSGLLVTELMGQGVNLLTGTYSRGASGFWVEDGEIQHPVEEITIASNLRDMFLGVVEVANDVDTRGNARTGSILIDNMMIAGG